MADSTGSLGSLTDLGDDLDNISGAIGDVLAIGTGISGSLGLALAISKLPGAFEQQ